MRVLHPVLIDVLHLFTLVSFAVAQPLYDVLGHNPEFFTSHKANPSFMIGLMVILSGCVACVLGLTEGVAWFLGDRIRRGVHWTFVCGLSTLTSLPLLQGVVGGGDFLIVILAFLLGLAFTIMYARWTTIRLFVTMLTPAVLAFPLWFMIITPAGQLIFPDTIKAADNIQIQNPVPVILVVLDEFNVTALLDSTGRIDPIRFPNFADLATKSWWFPNAVATSGSTERAVPAILTGMQPQTDATMSPTADEHPRNLFVMLGKDYRLNVSESLTTLCPPSLCLKQNDGFSGLDYDAFFSDVFIIYLHIIAPPQLKSSLPSLEAQWRDFGRMHSNDSNVALVGADVEHQNAMDGRDVSLRSFLSRLNDSPSPALHFLHVLLPHVTYEYLASGHRYFPSEGGAFPSGIMNEAVGWVGEEPLILTAYYQYLQQVGYLDRFFGQLTEKLTNSQLYEKALIIVTADHGVAFQRGRSRRGVQTGNENEILKIPMLVKLPGQREGRISERLVSSIDVLPTIVDVLDVDVSWDMDGRSMITEDFFRTEIEVPGIGVFKAKELEGFSRLRWQVDHFGMHSSLDRLVPMGPFPSLIGEQVNRVSIGPSSALRFFSGDLKYFEYVDPASGFLPALFRGYIEGTESRNLPLAVALNGQIWTTTTTSEWDGRSNFFSVLLPSEAFQYGKNTIHIYKITKTGRTLLPINSGHQPSPVTIHYDRSGKMQLVYPNSRAIPVHVDRGQLHGNLDSVNVLGNMLVFTGWGADLVAGRPAAEALIFAGEQLVARVVLDSRRDDVANSHHEQSLLHCGFHAIVPVELFHSSASEVRIVLVSQDDKTLGLSVSDQQRNIIEQALYQIVSSF